MASPSHGLRLLDDLGSDPGGLLAVGLVDLGEFLGLRRQHERLVEELAGGPALDLLVGEIAGAAEDDDVAAAAERGSGPSGMCATAPGSSTETGW
jgi:hypothetical protein